MEYGDLGEESKAASKRMRTGRDMGAALIEGADWDRLRPISILLRTKDLVGSGRAAILKNQLMADREVLMELAFIPCLLRWET